MKTVVLPEVGDIVEMWNRLDVWMPSRVEWLYAYEPCSIVFSAVDVNERRRTGAILINGQVPLDPNWRWGRVAGEEGTKE